MSARVVPEPAGKVKRRDEKRSQGAEWLPDYQALKALDDAKGDGADPFAHLRARNVTVAAPAGAGTAAIATPLAPARGTNAVDAPAGRPGPVFAVGEAAFAAEMAAASRAGRLLAVAPAVAVAMHRGGTSHRAPHGSAVTLFFARALNFLLRRRVRPPTRREAHTVVRSIAEGSSRWTARVGDLNAAFAGLDKDKDGQLSARDANGELPPAAFVALVRAADLNGDGKISQDEYAMLHLAREGLPFAVRSIEHLRCRRLFRALDTDWDGKLDLPAVRAAMAAYTHALVLPAIGDEDVLDRFNELDKDRDKRITYEEFIDLVLLKEEKSAAAMVADALKAAAAGGRGSPGAAAAGAK